MDANNLSDSSVKVPFDPGWNDPPKLSYNTQITPNKPRKLLNKRVAFPISGISSNPLPPSTGNVPPMAPIIPNPIQPHIPSTVCPPIAADCNEDDVEINSEDALTNVKDILLKILDSSSELGSKSNDIKRRLNTMEEMWLTGKLNKRIQLHMTNLSKALECDQPNKADDIHKALMVDYVSVVGTWMPGVKQLIHHCIARSELLAIDKE